MAGKYKVVRRLDRYDGTRVILRESGWHYHIVVETYKGKGKGKHKTRTVATRNCFYRADTVYQRVLEQVKTGKTSETVEV